jgi:hypothetical protein
MLSLQLIMLICDINYFDKKKVIMAMGELNQGFVILFLYWSQNQSVSYNKRQVLNKM